MALKATVFKADLQIADMDRHYYQSHALTIAQHPSETDQRMMVRVLAFALHADERLAFTRGISSEDEPDLWLKDLTDSIDVWIELGQPDERRLRKACGRAKRVLVYTYQSRAAAVWWQQNESLFARFDNLSVFHLDSDAVDALSALAQRNMELQCTIQDGEVTLSDATRSVTLRAQQVK